MKEKNEISIISNREHVTIDASTILYVIMNGRNSEIHVIGGQCYQSRTPLDELAEKLGDRFVRAHRSLLVNACAVHDVKKRIELSNGEALDYPSRKKKEIVEQLIEKRKLIIGSFSDEGIPKTFEEYCKYYSGFEKMPFAFTDIEMVFNDNMRAVDWIFRYGNPALAKLEKIPLEKLVGRSFGSLFRNVDSKWLRSYERATLYGETLEIIDFSPEIDTYLKIICFPTFNGHCGCLLFNVSEIEFTRNTTDAEKALLMYLGVVPTIKN